jgi:ABC-type amino acid transport system permease subunit
MIPAVDRQYLNLLLADSYLPVQPIKCEVTTLSGMVLCCSPKELNDIEFAMVFWQKQAKVTSCFHNLYNLALLLEEVWLIC